MWEITYLDNKTGEIKIYKSSTIHILDAIYDFQANVDFLISIIKMEWINY